MSKSSVETMQNDEQIVLNVLRQHGDIKMESLAKMTGFSKQKVWRITKKLEQTHMIWGYTAIDDIDKQNLVQFVLLVKRSTKSLSNTMKKEIIQEHLDKYLPGCVTIIDIYVTHGKYDSIVTFRAKDIVNAKKFVDMLLLKVGEYITEVELMRTLFPIRVRGIKNPDISKLVDCF